MQIENYINGNFVSPLHGRYLNNSNPAENIVIATIPNSTVDDVEMAVKSAHNAQDVWSAYTMEERIGWLRKIVRL